MAVLLVLILFACSFMPHVISETKVKNNYGAYIIDWKNYTLCRGPKAKNVSEITVKLHKYNNGTYICSFNITFLRDVTFEEVKTTLYKYEGGKENKLYTYKVTDPCHHSIFAEITKRGLHTQNSCHIKKGMHSLDVNFTEIAHLFLGKSFAYGVFGFYTVAIMKQGNIACFKFLVHIRRSE